MFGITGGMYLWTDQNVTARGLHTPPLSEKASRRMVVPACVAEQIAQSVTLPYSPPSSRPSLTVRRSPLPRDSLLLRGVRFSGEIGTCLWMAQGVV